MKLSLIQGISATTLQFLHSNPFNQQSCVDRFDSILIDDTEIDLNYKLNSWIPKSESCHYQEINGKGTLSLDHESNYLSGTLRHNKGLLTFNGTETNISLNKAVFSSPGHCETVDKNTIIPEEKRKRRGAGSHTYLELIFVVSSEILDSHNGDKKKTIKYFEEVFNIMFDHYSQAGINLLLLDILVMKKDPFKLVDNDHSENLNLFRDWRTGKKKKAGVEERFSRADSVLHFIPRSKFAGSTIGLAYTDVMCSMLSAGIVAADQESAPAVAATASHELGHNYGMSHDRENDPTEPCECKDGPNKCIMSAVISWDTPSLWSECSKNLLIEKQSHLHCLKDKPAPRLLFGAPVCGNGILEIGEDCDCGSFDDCTCCTDECKLPKGAECSPLNGACCNDSCQIKRKGSLCRTEANDCDLPEYCDGDSIVCPRNDFKHTGAACADGTGHCYGSECRKKDGQCQSMFGKTSAASDVCMSHYNTIPNNYFGGCGSYMTTCSPENAICGKQFCVGGGDRSDSWRGFMEISRPYDDLDCRSLKSFDFKMLKAKNISLIDESEPGMVENGVPCREDHFCILGSCEPVTDYYHCPDCNGHGTCSNHNQCKCDCGWSGDDCSTLAWCQEKWEMALLIMIVVASVMVTTAVLIYFICVFSCGKRWNFCFTKSNQKEEKSNSGINDTTQKVKVTHGSYDLDNEASAQLLPNKAPLVVKSQQPIQGTKSIKNKGYEEHKLLFPGKSPPKPAGAQIITKSELDELKRGSTTGTVNLSILVIKVSSSVNRKP